jgi:hypothetical protein
MSDERLHTLHQAVTQGQMEKSCSIFSALLFMSSPATKTLA